jgi:hypothetical protein
MKFDKVEPISAAADYEGGEIIENSFPLGGAKDYYSIVHTFQTGADRLFAVGYVEYVDIFGETRTTKFCFKIIPKQRTIKIAGSAAWNAFD